MSETAEEMFDGMFGGGSEPASFAGNEDVQAPQSLVEEAIYGKHEPQPQEDDVSPFSYRENPITDPTKLSLSLPEDTEIDSDMVAELGRLAVKLGLSQKQMQALVDWEFDRFEV